MNNGQTLRSLESATEVELSETLLLLQDTRQSFTAMKLWFRKYAPEEGVQLPPEDSMIADALFRDSIVQFVGNFDRKAEYPLDEGVVFAQVEGGAEFIRWLKDIRDSYAAHKFGTLRQCVAGVAINASGAVIGVGHLAMRGYPFGKEQEDQMLQCMSVVGRYLEAKVKDLEVKLMAEAQALPHEDLLRLPSANTYATATDEIRLSRKRLEKRRREGERPNSNV
jgi:hypothetical protein